MDSSHFSLLSSLRGEVKTEDYIQPHYKETYRLAIDRLLSSGRDSYQEFLKDERVGSFLSEEELVFITTNAEQPPPESPAEEINSPSDNQSNKSSSGTYWPMLSDVETPDLDLGWPEVMHERVQTNVDLLFHPPRQNNPTIKEVIRKHIQDARQVIAIVMDIFTDVDLFKEIVDASKRGVPVYLLLSDFHLKSFLTMAEKQDINLQQLRNMRVRAVKGQQYLCRSGAKFHGAMDQKFVLVDCYTAIYGSYSFTWSYEKINLSMVQIITGHLVQAYDEEFRTLYARSIVPAELCPPEGLFQHNGSQGRQILPKCVTNSGPKIERNHLRHTLDMVYRKTCERRQSTREFNEELCEEETLGPLENGIGVHTQMHDLQSAEMNYLKRHSYAGERQDGCIPQNIRSRASNWNISGDTGPNNYPTDNYLQASPMYRSQQIRQSYNGNDKHILMMQQNMPTLENTSKSFLRSWRIESYLKNADIPSGESSDYLDQFDPLDKASSFMQGRMRSSLVLRSPIPEQIEPNCPINNSSIPASHLTSNSPLHYSSMQWNPTATPENRINNPDLRFKRQSLQILDNNEQYGPERNSYPSGYASLGRPKGRQMMTNPDIITDSWQKRHSVADPRSNSEYMMEPPGHMYGPYARIQANRNVAGVGAQNGTHVSNLNEDQRSASHYDVKSPGTPMWQEPPSRTLSAAALGVNSPDLANKPSSTQRFSKKASSKIKSLLNIPEKKEGSMTILETGSLQSVGSTDTLTGEDERRISDRREHIRRSLKSSNRNSSGLQSRHVTEDHLTSKPRFRTEEHPHQPQVYAVNASQKKHVSADRNLKPSVDIGSWRNERCAENRVYSRYEPFSSLGNRHSLHTSPNFGNAQSQEKTKCLSRGAVPVEHNASRSGRGHHENKLEKFFQRVGNLINKHK